MTKSQLRQALRMQLRECTLSHCAVDHFDFCELCDNVICQYVHKKLHISEQQACQDLEGALLKAHNALFQNCYNTVYLPLIKSRKGLQ